MNKNKKVTYIVVGVLAVALVGAAAYFGMGEQFQGAFRFGGLPTPPPDPLVLDRSGGMKDDVGVIDPTAPGDYEFEAIGEPNDKKDDPRSTMEEGPGIFSDPSLEMKEKLGGMIIDDNDASGIPFKEKGDSPFNEIPEESSADGYRGACVILTPNGSLPFLTGSDNDSGYSIYEQQGSFDTLDKLRKECTEDDFNAMWYKFCIVNSGASGREQVALYNEDGSPYQNDCDSDCEYKSCEPV